MEVSNIALNLRSRNEESSQGAALDINASVIPSHQDIEGPMFIAFEEGGDISLVKRFDFNLLKDLELKHPTLWMSYSDQKNSDLFWAKKDASSSKGLLKLKQLPQDSSLYVDGYVLRPLLFLPKGQTWKKNIDINEQLKIWDREGQVDILAVPPLPKGDDHKTLLLDRDGIINYDESYVYRWEDFHFTPWGLEILKIAQESNIQLKVLTNQSGIGRGYYTEEQCQKLHRQINRALIEKGMQELEWFYSPYHHEGKGKFKGHSCMRKPQPGMLLKAFHEEGVNLFNALMVGDKKSDWLHVPGLKFLGLKGNYPMDGLGDALCETGDELVKRVTEWIKS